MYNILQKSNSGWQFRTVKYTDPELEIELAVSLESPDASGQNWFITTRQFNKEIEKYGVTVVDEIQSRIVDWGRENNLVIEIVSGLDPSAVKEDYLKLGWIVIDNPDGSFDCHPPPK